MQLVLPLVGCLLGASVARADGPRVLVVPYAGDNAELVERGLRNGAVSVAGADVADAATTAALIDGAKSTGLDCAANDGACWLKVALLGGLDTVISASSAGVTRAVVDGSTTSPNVGSGEAGWVAAVRRAFSLESALHISLTPASATATVDGVPAPALLVEGLAPGSHEVAASAAGFQPMSTTVGVAPGAVAEVSLVLLAVEAQQSTSLPATLAWGGGGTMALGVAAGLGLGIASWYAGRCSYGDPNDPKDDKCEDRPTADNMAIAGIGIGVGVGAIGAAVLTSSFFVQ